jgi:hypothetical protein
MRLMKEYVGTTLRGGSMWFNFREYCIEYLTLYSIVQRGNYQMMQMPLYTKKNLAGKKES